MNESPGRRLVRIYVDDHWAGAAAGTSLAGRLAAENEGTAWQAELRDVAAAIVADEEALAGVRRALGGRRVTLKRILATVGERLARLKLNGRWRRYSPLSRLEEIELLVSGVHAKQRLWRALGHCEPPLEPTPDLRALEARAGEQLAVLERLHDEAAAVAFGRG